MELFGEHVNQHGENGYGAYAEAGKLHLSAWFGPMGRTVKGEFATKVADAVEQAMAEGKGRHVDVDHGERVYVGVGDGDEKVLLVGSHSKGLIEFDEGAQGLMSFDEATQMISTIRGNLA